MAKNPTLSAAADDAFRKAMQEQVLDKIDHARIRIAYYDIEGRELLSVDVGRAELGALLEVQVAKREGITFTFSD